MIILVVLTYLSGFVNGKRLPPCVGASGHSRDETPGTGARKVAEGLTKYGVAKIAAPTKRQGQLEQWIADRRLIEATRKDSLPSYTSTLSTLIGACARSHDAGMALVLFDHMLKTGIAFDQQSVTSHISKKFFKVVAGNLDDKRMQKMGSSSCAYFKFTGSSLLLTFRISSYVLGRASFQSTSWRYL
jgi:pentatricopeptide repeat protein